MREICHTPQNPQSLAVLSGLRSIPGTSFLNIDLPVVPFTTTVLASENLPRVLEPSQILTCEHLQIHPLQVNFNLRALASPLRNWLLLRLLLVQFPKVEWPVLKQDSQTLTLTLTLTLRPASSNSPSTRFSTVEFWKETVFEKSLTCRQDFLQTSKLEVFLDCS